MTPRSPKTSALPPVWRRAVRLTRRGIEASLPLTRQEMQASRDQLRAAQAAWQPGPRNPGAEGADPQIRLALRGRPDPLGPEALPDFHRTAHAVFDGVLACRASDDDLDDGAAA